MDAGKSVPEVPRDPLLELPRPSILHELFVVLEFLFELTRQLCLDISRNLMSVDTMAIADHEQMEALLTAHVRRQSVSVLIHLVGIARLVAA